MGRTSTRGTTKILSSDGGPAAQSCTSVHSAKGQAAAERPRASVPPTATVLYEPYASATREPWPLLGLWGRSDGLGTDCCPQVEGRMTLHYIVALPLSLLRYVAEASYKVMSSECPPSLKLY